MPRGYRIRLRRPRPLQLSTAAAALLCSIISAAPALADSTSRYSAPLGAWIAAIVISIILCALGLAIGLWFHRKRSRLNPPT